MFSKNFLLPFKSTSICRIALFLGVLFGSFFLTPLAGHTQKIMPPRPPIIVPPPIWPPHPVPPVLNQELQLVSQNARVEIEGALAKTHLTQTFRNTTKRRVEGTYVFPLPAGASVSGFAMTMNGKRMEAEFLEGERARKIYRDIVSKLRDPAILEFMDRDLIRAKVFPIAAGGTQEMELEYSQPLRSEGGSFRYTLPLRLPVGGAAQSAKISVNIHSQDGIKAVYSPTHKIDLKRDGNRARAESGFDHLADDERDFVLYYTVSKSPIGVNLITHKKTGEDGYFMLLLAPDPQLSQEEIAAKDVVFTFDTSGSMQGEKIEQARNALLHLIALLNPNDRFNIVTFSSDTRTFRKGLVSTDKSTLDAARAWVQEIKAVGGTNIDGALTHSLGMLEADFSSSTRTRQVIFMTDGQPTVGETDIAQILKNASTINDGKTQSTRLFVFGVGYDVNTRLLDALAEENRGSSDYVLPSEDIEQKVGSLFDKIAFPVLSNPHLDWKGTNVYDVYPKVLPDLFKGTQTIVFGRYAGENAETPQLIGRSSGQEKRITSSGFSSEKPAENNELLARLWATRKIGYLMDQAQRSGRTIDPEVKEEIIQLGKKYGIVTPFTAGLITEDEPLSSAPRQNGSGLFPAQDAFGAGISSGRQAVQAARTRKEFREADRLPSSKTPVSQKTRTIAGKVFVLQGDIWTDTNYDPKRSQPVETIAFASPEYFALAQNPEIARWLSVGSKVLLALPSRTVRIE